MKTSPAGLAALCAREGFVPRPYNDPPGSARWSHGYGTGCARNAPPISEPDAMAEMAAHIEGDEAWIGKLVTVPLGQCQFDALVSFVYNEGPGALGHSSILMYLNEGQTQKAADAFLAWDKVMRGGQLVDSPELLARRQGERAQFLSVPEGHAQEFVVPDPRPTLPDAGQAAHDAIQEAALAIPIDEPDEPPPTA